MAIPADAVQFVVDVRQGNGVSSPNQDWAKHLFYEKAEDYSLRLDVSGEVGCVTKSSIEALFDRATVKIELHFTTSSIEALFDRDPVEAELHFTTKHKDVIASYSGVPADHETYKGEYVVDPKFSQQELETANKIVANDIIVTPIAVNQVTNLAGGYTVIIGRA